ncbi:MAG: uracil-DNA glycosylase [Burkholderiales bacterium]|nr:uracil-DNA glycosylase [Burkholderiales bacterium]
MQKRSTFSLLYKELWLVDKSKLSVLKPELQIKPWLDLSDNQLVKTIPLKTLVLANKISVSEVVNIDKVISPKTNAKSVDSNSKIAITKTKLNENNFAQEPLITVWDELVSRMSSCQKCNLCESRKNVVIERGNRNAKWMFIGEAPGENEDLQGLPFVGMSGALLDKMISAMDLNISDDVYICNVVKCRPPHNRNPEKEEVIQCNNYLLSQINLIQPKIIITLGKFASQTILNSDVAISQLRGKVHKLDDTPVISTFHPSYLLRNNLAKKDAWDDLQLAMKVYKEYENNN